MIRLTCFIRPRRLDAVKEAVAALGVSGLSVSDVQGIGNSTDTSRWMSAEAGVQMLPIQSRIEVVVEEEMKEELIHAITDAARTGEPGDGKIFVERLKEAIRIRTGERGTAAI